MGRLWWTPARVAELQRLRGDGLSGSEIAQRMGVTRNAVLGQMYRIAHPEAAYTRKPKNEDEPRYQRLKGGSTQFSVWEAWGLTPDALRRAIWAKARKGARTALKDGL